MIEITKLTVRSFDLDHLDLFWETSSVVAPLSDATPHEFFDYEFYVLRSESPMGPFDQIGGPLRDIYWFRDNSVSLLNKFRSYYYKILVKNRVTNEEQESRPVSSNDPPPDLIAAEVIRQEDMLFREFIGRKAWLFPARTFGPRCSCWDSVLGRRTRSNHLLCYGTGFLGGYLSPVECWIQIDPNTKSAQQTSIQNRQPSDTSARMISFPPVNPDDILVESENRRWKVITVGSTQRLRSPLHFEIALHEIPRGDVQFELPINVDAKSIQPVEERNYTNPTNIDGNDYSDIFAIYGHPRGISK